MGTQRERPDLRGRDRAARTDAPAFGQPAIGLNAHEPLDAFAAAKVLDPRLFEARAHPQPNRQNEWFHVDGLNPGIGHQHVHDDHLAFAAVGFNALWRSNRGRVHRSRRYVAWQQTAGWQLKLQRPSKIQGPVAINIAAGRPDQRKRDLDNIATKAVLDQLVAHQVTEDDLQGLRIAAGWDAIVPPGTLKITVEPALVMACAKA